MSGGLYVADTLRQAGTSFAELLQSRYAIKVSRKLRGEACKRVVPSDYRHISDICIMVIL